MLPLETSLREADCPSEDADRKERDDVLSKDEEEHWKKMINDEMVKE